MTHQILAQLRQLKLGGMASAMQSQQEMSNTYEGLSFEERLKLLLDQEGLSRDTRKGVWSPDESDKQWPVTATAYPTRKIVIPQYQLAQFE